MMPRLHVRQNGSRAAPQIVIETLRRRFNGRVAPRFVVAGAESDFDSLDRSQMAIPHHFDRLAEFRIGSLLRSDLIDRLSLSNRADEPFPLSEGMCERLFAVNVFSLLQCGERDERVPMIGRGDN